MSISLSIPIQKKVRERGGRRGREGKRKTEREREREWEIEWEREGEQLHLHSFNSCLAIATSSFLHSSFLCSLLSVPNDGATPTQDGIGQNLSDSERDNTLDFSLSSVTLTSSGTATQIPHARTAECQTGHVTRKARCPANAKSTGISDGSFSKVTTRSRRSRGSDQTSLTTTSELDFRKDLQALDADIARLQLQFSVAQHGQQPENKS